jgi:formylmethanofuran dehydrogenase subunit E
MPESELVAEIFECPKCGNRVMDDLVCTDNDTVICNQCNTEYNPLTGAYGFELVVERAK